jgi:hypothetical protein
MVSPLAEEISSRVIDVVQLGGQVGASPELVYKGFPGWCLGVGDSKLTN